MKVPLTVLQIKVDAVLTVLEEMAESIISTSDLSDLDNAIMYCRHLRKHIQYELAKLESA